MCRLRRRRRVPRLRHSPPTGAPAPWAGPRTGVSPALAFFLGLIPGVGAIYNGQYAKGLVHAVVWGVLMSIANSSDMHGLEPVFVMLVIAWWAYMAIEAHHTAQKLQQGEPVDEYSSVLNLRGGAGAVSGGGHRADHSGRAAAAAHPRPAQLRICRALLAGLLIAAGVYMLWARFSSHESPEGEVRHER